MVFAVVFKTLRICFHPLKVDFDKPDFNKFPRFSEIRGMEVALEPGEVLYIPNYWWHYIESESHRCVIIFIYWFVLFCSVAPNARSTTEDHRLL